MKFFYDFYDELRYVFKNCEDIISKYPYGLRNVGLEYISKYNVFNEKASKNYICYLLSFWINHQCKGQIEICRRIAIANTFMMLFAFIQDDVIDGEMEPQIIREMLSLGNLFFSEFMGIYREVFKDKPGIWNYYELYMKNWCRGIFFEQKNISTKIELVEDETVCLITDRAELVKVSAAAICVLSEKEEMIDIYSKSIERVLFSLQIADDYIDWKEDIKNKNSNILLYKIMERRNLKNLSQIKVEDVKNELIFGKLIDWLCIILHENTKKLKKILYNQNLYIEEYNNSILNYMENECSKYYEKKRAIELGGFSYWIEKNMLRNV
ncbi:UNVERIFIED_CONTAM: geranylgeranyl pyrophosphate synthase [Acetivibrio alkalicellulosi]